MNLSKASFVGPGHVPLQWHPCEDENYYYRYGDGSEPLILLTFWSLIGMVIASAFAFGVVVGVGGLLYLQLKYIKNNKTGIEEYIEQKAVSYRKEEDCDWEDFIYPYDLGWKRNFSEVLFSWSGETTGNGVWWPVRKGCDQFSLSISVNEEYVVTRGQRGWLYGFKADDEKLKGWFPRMCIRFTDKYPFQMEGKQSSESTTSSSTS
ncbi:hypothetical protein TELCIR_18147 [Teladorsagia circumcincta]|uniref:Uncharacterized protein n=1 Tax=Teladorsagia circumcincta TaxID=45464 RepID=A0A2G9TQZ8_TELCI|nr:hypothetical protein TELCIR_18147 [Teladorsagia circumcincta]